MHINSLKASIWMHHLKMSMNGMKMCIRDRSYYGLGIRIINVNGCDIYYHCGDTIGTNTFILFSKDLNLRCIFLTNMGNIDTENLKENIIHLI